MQKVMGWTAEIVRHPPKLVPEEVMRRWVREWAKEGVAIDRERFSPPEGPRPFFAEEVDRGAHVLVAGTKPQDEQGLRAAAGEWRSLRLRGDEPPDGEAFGSLMTLFRRFQAEVQLRRIYLPGSRVNSAYFRL